VPAKNFAKAGHLKAKIALLDARRRPHVLYDILFRDDLATAKQQYVQEIERTPPTFHGMIVEQQSSASQKESERPESEVFDLALRHR
jgi:hypothetical protein